MSKDPRPPMTLENYIKWTRNALYKLEGAAMMTEVPGLNGLVQSMVVNLKHLKEWARERGLPTGNEDKKEEQE
jgi:hypothetical protein